MDAGHPDPVGDVVRRHREGQRVDRALGRGVQGTERQAGTGRDGAGVDDDRGAPPLRRLAQMRQCGTTGADHAEHVHLEDPPPLVVVVVLYRADGADARVVDQDVDAAERLGGRADRGTPPPPSMFLSSTGPVAPMPALWTRMSMPPSASAAALTAARTAASSVTSAMKESSAPARLPPSPFAASPALPPLPPLPPLAAPPALPPPRPAFPLLPAAVASGRRVSRSRMATRAPRAPGCWAVASPMREAPPVTRAVSPSNSPAVMETSATS